MENCSSYDFSRNALQNNQRTEVNPEEPPSSSCGDGGENHAYVFLTYLVTGLILSLLTIPDLEDNSGYISDDISECGDHSGCDSGDNLVKKLSQSPEAENINARAIAKHGEESVKATYFVEGYDDLDPNASSKKIVVEFGSKQRHSLTPN